MNNEQPQHRKPVEKETEKPNPERKTPQKKQKRVENEPERTRSAT